MSLQNDELIPVSTSPICGPAYCFISLISAMRSKYAIYGEEILRIASQNRNERAQVLKSQILK
jgi:hypothetical protein